jgi:hypothetical protein
VQQNHAKLKHEYKQLKHAYKKKQRLVDQDVELAKTVEAGLMADRDEYKASVPSPLCSFQMADASLCLAGSSKMPKNALRRSSTA